MGKIFSKPKMPSMSKNPIIEDISGATGITSETEDGSEVTTDEQRVLDIMNRKRGRMGTIATSLSGVLTNETDNLPVRKTLLGE